MDQLITDMPWLAGPAQTLVQALEQNRMAHALLVTGGQGTGKRSLADALAALLVCERRTPGLRAPCGQCRQCQLVEGHSHPDIRVCQPEKSKMIRIDQVRALSGFAVGSPQVAGIKVIIMDRADQLNINAANALLKTLEEPAGDVVLILLQETGRPVLPTIRSRCRVVAVPAPDRDQALGWLVRQPLTADGQPGAGSEPGQLPDPDLARLALDFAGGSPRLALSYLQSGFVEQRIAAGGTFRDFLKGAATLPETSRVLKGLGQDVVLHLFESWASDLARVSAGGQGQDASMASVMGYLARHNPPWQAHGLAEKVRESRLAMVNNASPDLETARLLMAWRALMPVRRRSPAGDRPA